jgi:hypothetical protein
MTAMGVLRASATFEIPFPSIQRCREELQEMYRAKLLNRAEIPGTGRGQKPLAYFLRRGSRGLVAEVEHVPRSNHVFTGLGRSPWHALAVGELGSYLEAHAAEQGGFEIVERIRDRQFHAKVTLGEGQEGLFPDSTLLLRQAGRHKIVFVELVNQTSVINPAAGARRRGSLAHQLDKYRAFGRCRSSHPIWQRLEGAYGHIGGFQVLVVSTRNNTPYLLSAAHGSRSMFIFTDLDSIRGCRNLFADPIWWLPSSRWTRGKPQATALIEH